ncbi:MAG TPA: tetratricopeptide repeat protein [Verrucomicrobiae bacterium]|nr:tetratricopeptide repeat protein [Verrucomicrobiae bacterium]
MKIGSILIPVAVGLSVVYCSYWRLERVYDQTRALQGDREAQYRLGQSYLKGEGASRSYPEAIKWFRQAAEHGQPGAQTALGLLYFQGDIVPRKDSEAIKWLRKAAQQGVALAQNQLGIMCAQGRGTTRNLDEAIDWFSRAARQEFPGAQKNLRIARAAKCNFLPRVRTRDGRTYTCARVQKIEPDGITVSYVPQKGAVGVAKLKFKNLPADVQERYGYDPTAAGALSSAGQMGVVIAQQL